MNKFETLMDSDLPKFLVKFENKVKKYPRLHKVLYTKHPSNILLLILVSSALFSLILTLSGCATYVEPYPYQRPQATVIVGPPVIIVPGPYYYGWHGGYYHGYHGGWRH